MFREEGWGTVKCLSCETFLSWAGLEERCALSKHPILDLLKLPEVCLRSCFWQALLSLLRDNARSAVGSGALPTSRCGAAVTQGLIAPVSVTRPRAVPELFPPAFCKLHKLLTGMLLGRRGDGCCLAQRSTASRALWEATSALSPAGFFGQSFSSRIVQRCLCLFVCVEMTCVIA